MGLLIVKTHLMKWVAFAAIISFNVAIAIMAVAAMAYCTKITMNVFQKTIITTDFHLVTLLS